MGKGHIAGIDPDQGSPATVHWDHPDEMTQATLILAHGAGAPMDSDFMQAIAALLAARGVAVARFEFPYMAQRRIDGRKRPPNPQGVLLDCWREVYREVRGQVSGPLAIGGKSMGGRMASLLADELQADALVCLGYPFHPPGKPEKPRVAHLAELRTPTLIVQGERDPFGGPERVAGYVLPAAIHLHWLEAADHDFSPLKSTGLTQAGHLATAADAMAAFLLGL
jgi:predicted alpha/beta-hydrolase family hydrolase